MTYTADKRALESCPGCSSGRLMCILGLEERLDICLKCFRVWEPLPAGEPYTTDGEQLAFRVPCGNCAFRGKSAERQDADAWQDLQHMLSAGGRFYCHKGVPFRITNPEMPTVVLPGDRGFEFPRVEKTADIAGKSHPYLCYDTDRMRLCRGYLNVHIALLLKEAPSHAD